MKGKVSIKDIVARVKLDLGKTSSDMDLKVSQYVIDCAVDLSLYVANDIAVKTLEVSSNNTIDIPLDFVKYRKLAVVSGGRMCVLKQDHDLAFRETGEKEWCDPNMISASTDSSDVYGIWRDYGRNGQNMGEQYAASSSANIPRFRINRRSNRIELASNLNVDKVVLEYVGTGDIDSQSTISREFIPVIQDYVHWKLTEYDKEARIGDKDRRERAYKNSYRKAQHFTHSFTPEDFMDAIYSARSSSVR